MRNIKRVFTLFLLFVILVTTLGACKSPSIILPTKTETWSNTMTKEVLRDTVFVTEKDSSYYKAWLECKEGKVVIKEVVKTSKGKYLQPPKVIIKDNYIKIDCEAEAQKLFAKWKDTYTLENKQTTITNTIEIERKLSWFENVQIACGWIFILLLIIVVIITILRWRRII